MYRWLVGIVRLWSVQELMSSWRIISAKIYTMKKETFLDIDIISIF